MEQEVLRKVQLCQLEIAKEIKRVCEENGIRYFLYRGTFLGAVRHKGFIPWDDDMDFAMLREDYDKFCAVAPVRMKPEYALQTWHTEPGFSMPFAKIRKRGTVYTEAKSGKLRENGIFVDIYPLDYAPPAEAERQALAGKLLHLFRLKLMKSGYTPWMEDDRVLWIKRIGYLPYQAASLFVSERVLVKTYERLVLSVGKADMVYEQSALPTAYYYATKYCEELADYPFEDTEFPGFRDYDTVLSELYGDYMQLPPEEKRENRHQIQKIDFGC